MGVEYHYFSLLPHTIFVVQDMSDYSLMSVYFGGGNWKGRQGRTEGKGRKRRDENCFLGSWEGEGKRR